MRCGWAKRTTSPIAGPGRVHAPVLPTIKGPNRHICSVRSAPNAEPAPPSCCQPAILKLCSFTSMRSQPKSLRALTLLFSLIKPGGMAPRPSRFQTTSRSSSFRHARPNSTAKKISGNSCGRTGCRTEFSNPSTTSSITAATPGTRSSISRGKSCLSPAAIGQPQVTQSEYWYKRQRPVQKLSCADCVALLTSVFDAPSETAIRDYWSLSCDGDAQLGSSARNSAGILARAASLPAHFDAAALGHWAARLTKDQHPVRWCVLAEPT